MSQIAAVLPTGFWQDGFHQRRATLRPLTGEDEVFLLETVGDLLPAQRVTAMLERCLTSLGSTPRVTTEHVQALTVGDREALLLQLRRLTLGDTLACLSQCPNPACSEKLDLALRASDLLQPVATNPQPWFQTDVQAGEV